MTVKKGIGYVMIWAILIWWIVCVFQKAHLTHSVGVSLFVVLCTVLVAVGVVGIIHELTK
jgi:hypothetical protein